MRKVLIIGGNGSGKTTMARQLAEITGLPLCHLDTLYWTDDWQPRERSEFITLLQAELEKEKWILDGNMRRTLPQRLPYCDTVIYLDFSGIRCFLGTLKRLVQNHGQSRPDMGGNCPERFDFEFLRCVWEFNKKHRKRYNEMLDSANGIKVIKLKNRKEASQFLENL